MKISIQPISERKRKKYPYCSLVKQLVNWEYLEAIPAMITAQDTTVTAEAKREACNSYDQLT